MQFFALQEVSSLDKIIPDQPCGIWGTLGDRALVELGDGKAFRIQFLHYRGKPVGITVQPVMRITVKGEQLQPYDDRDQT